MLPALCVDHACQRRGFGALRARHGFGALRALALAPLVVLLACCSSHVRTPYLPGSAPAMFHPIAAEGTEFDYPGHGQPAGALDSFVADAGDYWIRAVATRSSDPVTARYYQGKAAGAKPLVIVLPVWGVSAWPSDTIAAGLRQRGAGAINVLQVDGDRMLFDWAALGNARSEAELQVLLALMVERFIAMVIDIRRLVDWAEARPEIDARRIALIGFSMSAIVGSIALANEPRIDVGVLVLGGADPHAILATCNGRIRRTRERLLERFGWSIEDLEEQLKAPLAAVNPVRFAGTLDAAGLLVIDAAADDCIPAAARERFWHAMGQPERVTYPYGHRATFLAMTFLGGHDLQRQIYRFLDRKLAPRFMEDEAVRNLPGGERQAQGSRQD